MSRKNTPVIIGGVVVGVLAIALLGVLITSISSFGEKSDELAKKNNELARLRNRSVFPSEENAELMQDQVETYQDYLQDLSESLRKNQSPDVRFTRDRFIPEFGEALRAIYTTARKNGVAIAVTQPDMLSTCFGLGLYKSGTPPSSNDLPRVMSQIQDIKALGLTLCEAGIAEIVSFSRTEFETAAALAAANEDEDGASRRRRRNRDEDEAPAELPGALFTDPDGLFTRESYTLTFKASDAALRKVLDAFAKGQPFAVVTSLDVSNAARPAVQAPPTAEPEPAAPAPVSVARAGGFTAVGSPMAPAQKEAPVILQRDLRVTAGKEVPTVVMGVDVYRFKKISFADEDDEGVSADEEEAER